MRRSVMGSFLCLSTLVLVAGKCDGDPVVTTSNDSPAMAADPDSVSEDAAAALAEPMNVEGAARLDASDGRAMDSGAQSDPQANTSSPSVEISRPGNAGKEAGPDGDIFGDPLGGEDGMGDALDPGDVPNDDAFLEDPSYEAPPLGEP